MDRSCGGGKTDGAHQPQPCFLLLIQRVDVIAGTARAAIAAKAAVAIAAEAAVAVTARAAAPVVAVAIGLAHHGRRTFLKLFDADCEIADHVFTDPFLAL